jgi:DNA polymerase III alpha subunit
LPHATLLGGCAPAINDTDEYSLAGVERAHVAANAHGMKLIIGWKIVIVVNPP